MIEFIHSIIILTTDPAAWYLGVPDFFQLGFKKKFPVSVDNVVKTIFRILEIRLKSSVGVFKSFEIIFYTQTNIGSDGFKKTEELLPAGLIQRVIKCAQYSFNFFVMFLKFTIGSHKSKFWIAPWIWRRYVRSAVYFTVFLKLLSVLIITLKMI